jgi:hypothetical protein
MPLRVESIVVAGQTRLNYVQDPPDASKPVMLTGPVSAPIELADGTVIDVSPPFIELASVEQAGEVSHRIGLRYEEEGHPGHQSRFSDGYDPLRDEFHHTCDSGCGAFARTPEEQEQAFAARLRRLGYARLVDTDEHQQVVARLAAMRAVANPDQEG